MKNSVKKVLSLAVAVSMIAGLSVVADLSVSAAQPLEEKTYVVLDYDRNNNYYAYLEANKDAAKPQGFDAFYPVSDASWKIGEDEAEAAEAAAEGIVAEIVDYSDKTGVLHVPGEKTYITWNVNVPEAGKYNLFVEFQNDEKARNKFASDILINGKVPFNELLDMSFNGVYKDRNAIETDSRGDDLRPRQDMVKVWQNGELKDADGNYNGNFDIVFAQGNNTVTLFTQGEPVYISGIRIKSIKSIPSYAEMKAEYEKNGYKEITTGEGVKWQAEEVSEKSSSAIYPMYDKASAATEPQSASNIKMNIMGGSQWSSTGAWIRWNFDVPETGLYKLNIKFRQNAQEGLYVSRNIYIDEEIPFKELEGYKFIYNGDWQNDVLGTEDEDFLFYLEKGNHTMKMEVTMGTMADVVRVLNDSVFQLNDMYKRIILISGTTPDQFRDYNFPKLIPDLLDTWTEQADILESQVNIIKEITGSSGSLVASISTFARSLDDLVAEPRTISSRLSTYNDSISSLSSYLQNLQNQALEIDYFEFLPVNAETAKPEAGGWTQFVYECGRFINSFIQDYSLTDMSQVNEESRVITVWVSTGRDQAQVLKDMIADLFTPETGIQVNLQLVQGSVIEATLAGKGPDIALMQATAQPVNFAIRGALVDLKEMAETYDADEGGWEAVASQFSPGAVTPFQFDGSVYALPETQAFDVMFYRKDVFAELGLTVPRTWEEFYQIVPVLQRNNLVVGLPDIGAAVSGVVQSAPMTQNMFSALVFQKGGRYYKEDLKSTAFDEEPAKEAFAELVECYTKFDFPVKYNFYNRFRSGEMPLAVQAYTQFNQLSAAAPEIEGLWDMAPIPGTIVIDENGNELIDRSQGSVITGAVMFEKTKDKEAAWEFLKWYTGAEAQARYALDMEAIMGPAARQAVSNLEAFEDLPWTKDEKEVLKRSWDEVRGIEELPGSYYTARGIQNAFRLSAYNYENPYEQFALKNKEINEEIKRKYEEFGLTDEDVTK